MPFCRPAARGRPGTRQCQDLKRLSIEELAELDVRTAARRVQRLSDTAAAVSVIREEDIRRSGYTNLADALRLADGLDVARVNSSTSPQGRAGLRHRRRRQQSRATGPDRLPHGFRRRGRRPLDAAGRCLPRHAGFPGSA
ncbi:MAG: TonB-dependent receptor plug domain-containing protein [Acidobacteria bacterium]|nr:TonB-dependent receptor plug domain-containing protein [Acidobacteriota bacterium]